MASNSGSPPSDVANLILRTVRNYRTADVTGAGAVESVKDSVLLEEHFTNAVMEKLKNSTFFHEHFHKGASALLLPTPPESGAAVRRLTPAASLWRVPAPRLLEQLGTHGWAVLDGALPAPLVHGGTEEAETLLRTGMLRRSALEYGPLRTGASSSLFRSPSWPHLSSLIGRMHAAARRLPGDLVPDPTAMLACYGPGERYNMHVDNNEGSDADADADVTTRRVTLLVYLRRGLGERRAAEWPAADWQPHEEGELRLWPHGDVGHWARALNDAPGAPKAVDIEPRGGRLVIFNASHPHEVRPTRATARCALQVWCHKRAPLT